MAGLANGSLADSEQLGAALDQLLSGLLTSPGGNQVAGWLSDLLDKASTWLHTPIGAAPGGNNGTGASPGGADLGAAIGSILGNISSTVSGITNATADGNADAGQIASSVADGLGGVLGKARPAGGMHALCLHACRRMHPALPVARWWCHSQPTAAFPAPPCPARRPAGRDYRRRQ